MFFHTSQYRQVLVHTRLLFNLFFLSIINCVMLNYLMLRNNTNSVKSETVPGNSLVLVCIAPVRKPVLSRYCIQNLDFALRSYTRLIGAFNLYPFSTSPPMKTCSFSRDSILFNYRQNKVVKHFPQIHGNGSRNYPSTGSSVILFVG